LKSPDSGQGFFFARPPAKPHCWPAAAPANVRLHTQEEGHAVRAMAIRQAIYLPLGAMFAAIAFGKWFI
jgi:hypothetical protein